MSAVPREQCSRAQVMRKSDAEVPFPKLNLGMSLTLLIDMTKHWIEAT